MRFTVMVDDPELERRHRYVLDEATEMDARLVAAGRAIQEDGRGHQAAGPQSVAAFAHILRGSEDREITGL